MMRTLISLLPDSDRSRVSGYLALTVVSTVLRAAAVVLVVPVVSALFGDNPGSAWPWVGALTAVVAAGWVVDSITSRVGFDLGFAILTHAQRDVSTQVTRAPLRWFTADNSATARRAIATTGPDLVGLVGYLVTPMLQALLLPVLIGLALLPIAWPVGVVALVMIPLLLGALWATELLTRKAGDVAAEANSALTERVLEFARTQAALRAARRVEPARSQAGAAAAAQHGALAKLLTLHVPGQVLFSLASQLALFALAGTTAWLAVDGRIGAPEAIALIVVIVRFLEPFAALGDLAPATATTRKALRDIGAVLDAPGTAAIDSAPPNVSGPADVELRGVDFAYGDNAVLRDVNVVFDGGRTTAIVGPSGSGKSTLLTLVAGLETVAGGSVIVDGVDRRQIDPADRAAATSVVFQQPYLFAGTIRDNVLAGNPDATDEELQAALQLARVSEFADRLPDGLDTVVGEAGGALSGGERQRVSIARALLKASSVLLVDEGTSALDAENEAAVVDAISNDPRGRTRVVVTHRLSTISGADRVLFLEDGCIVEDGSVSDLLAAGGRFAQFWQHQQGAAEWTLATNSPT
ncbi:MAG: ABC transporter ATP-binding protein [Rhodococcus sp.]|nr:ABC transporter ATP-binding protein [Rhodococcus sp. (in: high G+C Gram-positive bacteria)]